MRRIGVRELLHLQRLQALRDLRVALWAWACGNGEQQVVLEQDADVPRLGWQRVEMAPLQRHTAREAQTRVEGAADRREKTRFAGAAGAHYGVDLAWSNHDPQIPDKGGVGDAQPLDVDLQSHRPTAPDAIGKKVTGR